MQQNHSIQVARNSLFGNAVIRFELSRATGISNEQLEFTTSLYGKPLFVNNPDIHFNISHAGNYIVCAFDDRPVGIDVEHIKSVNLKITERFFSTNKKKYVMEKDSINRFYEVWTKKESRIKWEGKGLYMLSTFCVFDKYEESSPSYHCVMQDTNAVCHVCSTKKDMPSIKIIDSESFIKNLL